MNASSMLMGLSLTVAWNIRWIIIQIKDISNEIYFHW
jgi:hypothetical protein